MSELSQIKRSSSKSSPNRLYILSLRGGSILRFSYFPTDLVAKINQTIKNTWPRGISHEEAHPHSCYQITLLGTAFGLTSQVDFVHARRMLAMILKDIYESGYRIWDTAILNGSSKTFDTLFFAKIETITRNKNVDLTPFSLAITNSDTLQIVDPPPKLREWLHNWIPKAWPKGYVYDEDDGVDTQTDNKPPTTTPKRPIQSLVFRLKGKPFAPISLEEELLATAFVGGLMTGMRGLGWDVLASTNTTNGTNPRNIWYFANLRDAFNFGKLSSSSKPQEEEPRPTTISFTNQPTIGQPPSQTIQLGSSQLVIQDSAPINIVVQNPPSV